MPAVNGIVLAGAIFAAKAWAQYESSIPGYEMMIPSWEVEVFPGQPPAILNGTVEEVIAQIKGLNGTLADEITANVEASIVAEAAAVAAAAGPAEQGSLEKRTDFSHASYSCGSGGHGWRGCLASTIDSGISYLRHVNGKPHNGPGPGNCGRVSCSYGAAIYWCNDDRHGKTLNSFGSIADGAHFIRNKCSYQPDIISRIYVRGQAFHPTNWNVIVRADNC